MFAWKIDKLEADLCDAEREHSETVFDLEEKIDNLRIMCRQLAAGAHSDLALAVVEERWDDALDMSDEIYRKAKQQ